jgi:cyclopropane-fatty-acyl-phospholipid synthase
MTDILMPRVRRVAPIAARRSRRAVHGLLARLAVGRLDLIDPQGQVWPFAAPARRWAAPEAVPRAVIRVHDDAVYARVLASGDIGLGEAYVAGEWSSPDLVALMTLLLRNRDALERVVHGRWWGTLVHRVMHTLHRNSRSGSRRNIEAHYDLGNAFYRLWLDPSMNYSSAWFDGDDARPLEQAQHAKVDRALDEARVAAGSRVLEIGCGWGALAERAAQRGASVDGITLSNEQLAWGTQRLHDAGLAPRARLRLEDYRDLGRDIGRDPIRDPVRDPVRDPGRASGHGSGRPSSRVAAFVPYDAVVSIEMFEAVGRAYWPGWFATLARCLAPGGRACVQTITIRDDLFERYAASTDFIQQYVFPGGLLPGPQAFRDEAAKAGLVVERELAFGADYARTLRHWRQAFLGALPQVRALGYDDRFVRLWEFYLAYCEAAFTTGNTDVRQFTLRHA